MVEQLWAPWRLEYVRGDSPRTGDNTQTGCILCDKVASEDSEAALVVHADNHATVTLNLFPYNAGHLMVVPNRHVATLADLHDDEFEAVNNSVRTAIAALTKAMNPQGFNVGLNMGAAAGAGIADHLHWHVVPRWNGDTNFMPVLADIKVMPQHLAATRDLLADACAQIPQGDT